MVIATPHTVTHPNCDASDAAGVILANVRGVTLTDAITALARAYESESGSAPIGRARITHTGYQRYPVPSHYDASTARYRITLGRLV
jgi:hypothetical protein